MSQISDLRNNEKNQFNFIKLLERLSEHSETKYIKMFDRLLKSRIRGLVNKKTNEFFTDNEIENLFIAMLFSNVILPQEMAMLNYFCQKDKQGAIKGVDTQKATIDEILVKATSLRRKELEAEKENMVEKIVDSEEWLVLLPLTYEASLKYGSHTKWCTAMKEDKSHFNLYTNNGILIYCINKKTDVKYGFHYEVTTRSNYQTASNQTLWDAEDKFVELIHSDLPIEVLGKIGEYTKNNKVTNAELLKQKYTDITLPAVNHLTLAGIDDEIIVATKAGRSLEAVKLIKQLANIDLKQAKELYDNYYRPTYG